MKTTRVLTEKELCLLFLLADGNGHPSWEIEKKLGIDPGNLSRLVNKLERDDWIYRTENWTYSNGSRGYKKEYPLYIQKDRFQLVVNEIDRLLEILKEERKLKELKMSKEEQEHEMLYGDGNFHSIMKTLDYLKWVETPLYQLELQKVYQKHGFKNREDFINWQKAA